MIKRLLLLVFISSFASQSFAIFKNTASQKVAVYVYDTSAEESKTGDAANITAFICLDGAASVAITDTNPTELDVTNQPGLYLFDLLTTETNANLLVITADSSTANTWIQPVSVYTRTPERGTDSALLDADINITGGVVQSNVKQVSDDSLSADNLELQYDNTTGLSGDTFPATQSQVNQIANVAGEAKRSPSGYVLTSGTQSANTVSATEELDGTRHEHTDIDASIDLYYEFNIGSGLATEVKVTGYLQGNNDDLEVYGFDWVSSSWKQIGSFSGQASSLNVVNAFDLLIDMVGSGANEGIVRVRFFDGAFTLTGATLAIDQILVEFAQSVEGYQNGAVWLDTKMTNTNTVRGVDGTATNPVATIAAANTLLASTNLSRVEVAPQSSITFVASQENQSFFGKNWTLALGGQSISGSFFEGADVSGIGTGALEIHFDHCHFDNVTLPPGDMENCVLENTFTIGTAGNFFFENCMSGVAGTSTPALDFGSALNSSNVNFRSYSGGIEVQNMGAGTGSYEMSLEGWGRLVINANCSTTANIAVRGLFTVSDLADEAVTLSDNARYDVAQINAQADLALSDYDGPTNAEMEARTLVAASYFDPVNDTVANVTTNSVTITNVDMVGTNNALLDADINLSGGVVESNLLQMGGVVQSGTDLKDFADAGYNPATDKVTGVLLTDTTTDVTNGVTVSTVTDKTGYSLAADQSAVTIGTVTTNTDQVGTNGANTTVPDAAGVVPTAVENREEMDSNSTQLAEILDDLATSGSLTTHDTSIKALLPSALVSGKMDSSVSDIVQAAMDLFFSRDSGNTSAGAVAGSVVKEIVDNAGGSGLTTETIATATVETLMADTPTIGNVITVQEIIRIVNAVLNGKMTREGDASSQEVIYFADDDNTELTTHTIISGGRTIE